MCLVNLPLDKSCGFFWSSFFHFRSGTGCRQGALGSSPDRCAPRVQGLGLDVLSCFPSLTVLKMLSDRSCIPTQTGVPTQEPTLLSCVEHSLAGVKRCGARFGAEGHLENQNRYSLGEGSHGPLGSEACCLPCRGAEHVLLLC